MLDIENCPSTLAPGFNTYSPVALKKLFNKQRVSPILPYESIEINEEDTQLFLHNKERISISGAQTKYSMIVDNGVLKLTTNDEQGHYIFKPKPSDIRNPYECAANENLTMQIAEQVFNIETAANGLCFFRSGEIAYITKRFDITSRGKVKVEDFASLAGLTSINGGPNFKYNYSYQELAELIKKFVSAWRVELLKYYRLILFNFLFSNGDAHLKNFSVIEINDGDYCLSPAYDLLNTSIHVDDSDFALDKGLFEDGGKQYLKGGMKANGASFKQFGLLIGLPEKVIDKEFNTFTKKFPQVEELVNHSFLSDKVKKQYFLHYQTRRNRLTDMIL